MLVINILGIYLKIKRRMKRNEELIKKPTYLLPRHRKRGHCHLNNENIESKAMLQIEDASTEKLDFVNQVRTQTV